MIHTGRSWVFLLVMAWLATAAGVLIQPTRSFAAKPESANTSPAVHKIVAALAAANLHPITLKLGSFREWKSLR